MKDKLSFLALIIILIGMAIMMIVTTGCSTRTEVVKYKFIKSSYPRLAVYQGCDRNLTLNAYKKNNHICVKEWNDSCIPEDSFIKLYKYAKKIKTTCQNYEFEVKLYNKKFTKKQ